MRGDFSRDTFESQRHFRRVLMQQGRVEVDADVNEQSAIDQHVETATTYDVVGPSGVPLAVLPDGTPAGGFNVALNNDGSDLTISPGRMYVEGLLVENDLPDASLLKQSERPFGAGTTLSSIPELANAPAGTYVVYLDVWERLVTSLDNSLIRETALGGPDTSVRSRVTWQLKLAQAKLEEGTTPTCDSVGDDWRPKNANQGEMAAQTGPPQVDEIPCVLPPETGYRRLENQLYRIEIHSPGGYGAATYKWSRENGSVVAGIVAPSGPNPPTTVSGPTFQVTTVGRDDSLGFKPGDWVELIDDRGELLDGHGELLQVQIVTPATLTITTKTAATTPVDLAMHPKLRRWDEVGDGLGSGVGIVDGSWVDLEEGVQVQFSNGQFGVGDYWQIPARTKTTVANGHLEWPLDDVGNPLLLPPRGIVHHYAKLALVEFDGTHFTGKAIDCRPSFPPLTQLTPSQPATTSCTITPASGPGWEKPVLAWFNDPNKAIDGEICFPIGDFPVTSPVVIATTGSVKVTGAGWGTRLGGAGLESVLRFVGCSQVVVRDLAATSSGVDAPKDPGRKHINGTLEFQNCSEVDVENVSLACGSATIRGAACVTAINETSAGGVVTGGRTVRVKGCRLSVGEMQFGILVVQVARSTIEDNEIFVDETYKPLPLAQRLSDPKFMAMARSALLASPTVTGPATAAATRRARLGRGPQAGAAPPADVAAPAGKQAMPAARGMVSVTVGKRAVTFISNPNLQSTWQTFFDTNAPKQFATDRDLLAFIRASATSILKDPAARANLSGFQDVVHLIQQEAPLMARGIAVGGQFVGDLHIRDNLIDGALQGITAGFSHREKAPPARPDRGRAIRITGNSIDVRINALSARVARHAIFVGNVDSLQVEDNTAHLSGPANFERLTDGIRVFGYLGKKMIVRHNHLVNFSSGILVTALAGVGKYVTTSEPFQLEMRQGPLWLIADNVLEGARVPITAPACTLVDNVSG